jgi:hypothetical protein
MGFSGEKTARPRTYFYHGAEGNETFSFISALFNFSDTVLPSICPQILFMIFLIICASFAGTGWLGDIEVPAGVNAFHALLGSFLGLVFGLDLGTSLGNYNSGVAAVWKISGQMRIILANSNTFALKPGADMKKVSALREKIRQKCNVLFLFMRQRMREARVGFHPGTKMRSENFDIKTFCLDPAEPQAANVLSSEDIPYYASIPVGERPIAVECELQQLASELALHVYCPGEFGEYILHPTCSFLMYFVRSCPVTQTHDAISSAMSSLTTCMTIINGGTHYFRR